MDDLSGCRGGLASRGNESHGMHGSGASACMVRELSMEALVGELHFNTACTDE